MEGTLVRRLRAFHDTALGDGSLPLVVLEEVVEEWLRGETGAR